jgi:hypothetical protein
MRTVQYLCVTLVCLFLLNKYFMLHILSLMKNDEAIYHTLKVLKTCTQQRI